MKVSEATETARGTSLLPSAQAISTSHQWNFGRKSRRAMCSCVETQMWCFGADIRYPHGNLLLEFGFQRERPPEGISGSSAYRITYDGTFCNLWGFSILFSQRELGTLQLRRHDWEPRWDTQQLNLPSLWQATALPRLGRPKGLHDWERARELLRRGLDFLAHYELWIEERRGTTYREKVKSTHPNARRSVFMGSLSSEWRRLGQTLGPECRAYV